MVPPRSLSLVSLCLCVAGLRAFAADPADWPDGTGERFRGEPASVFGPLALFRTKDAVLKRVPFRVLSPEDCQRFYRGIADRPARAAHWSDAQSKATRELVGTTKQLNFTTRTLVSAQLAAPREPELLVVFYGYQNLPGSWLIVNNIGPNYQRVQRLHPGLVSGVFYGLAPSTAEHENMALSAWMPWLVTDFTQQGRIPSLRRFEQTGVARCAILTRHGDPLLLEEPTDMNIVRRCVDEFVALAWLTDIYNTSAWADREHYGRAVRPLQFARTSTGPELIGNPLRPDGLRVRGVGRVEAQVNVDATGKVTAVALQPGSRVPEALAGPIADAVRRSAVFLPAIDHGQETAGTYNYILNVPPADARLDADAAWLDRSIRGEIPLRDWLLLTSLPVDERDFSDIESVASDGTVRMKAIAVGTAQVSGAAQASAFNTNFFDREGAASVTAKIGQKQVVDGRTLTWRAVKSLDGYVDMKTGHKDGPDEYCVGYAWTEIEVSAPLTAWLGIGSDDGLKVWLNGELVNDRWLHRISHLDDDVVPLKLKAGANRILLKVQNKTRNWSFTARLRYRER